MSDKPVKNSLIVKLKPSNEATEGTKLNPLSITA